MFRAVLVLAAAALVLPVLPAAAAAQTAAPPAAAAAAPRLYVTSLPPCKGPEASASRQFPCLSGPRSARPQVYAAPYALQNSTADVGLDPATLEALDASDALAQAIRALPAAKRTPAMVRALALYEQTER